MVKKHRGFMQSRIVIVCLVFVFCMYLFTAYFEFQRMVFYMHHSTNYIAWSMDNRLITTARLLALGGIVDASVAGIIESIFVVIYNFSKLFISGFLLIFVIRNQKEIRPFTMSVYKYLKFGILLMICTMMFDKILQIMLLIITQPPVDWANVIQNELANIVGILFNVIVYLYLLFAWHKGIDLQAMSDETI